jgi:hypothetical protein
MIVVVEYAFYYDLRKLTDIQCSIKAIIPASALAHIGFDASGQQRYAASVDSAKVLLYDAFPIRTVRWTIFDPDTEHIYEIVCIFAL